MIVIENRTFHKVVFIACQIVRILFIIASVLFAAWFGWSLIEVWVHNATLFDPEPYQYSSFNLFELLMSH